MHFAPDPATEKKNKSNKNEITCCFSYILKVSSSLLLAGSSISTIIFFSQVVHEYLAARMLLRGIIWFTAQHKNG